MQFSSRSADFKRLSEGRPALLQVRIGLPEGLVRRALVFMTQQGELEHKRERRLVHRLR